MQESYELMVVFKPILFEDIKKNKTILTKLPMQIAPGKIFAGEDPRIFVWRNGSCLSGPKKHS